MCLFEEDCPVEAKEISGVVFSKDLMGYSSNPIANVQSLKHKIRVNSK